MNTQTDKHILFKLFFYLLYTMLDKIIELSV